MADITLYVDGTNDAASHRFVSLDAALDHGVADHADLTAATGFNGLLKVEISIATADTLAATVSGFTTDATHYVYIYTTAAARHAGVWSDSKYRLTRSTTNSRPLTVLSAYTVVEGLQIASLSTAATGSNAVAVGTGTGILLDRCLLKCHATGTTATQAVLYNGTSGGSVTVRNSILYGPTTGPGAIYTVTGTTITCQNCTLYVPNASAVAYRAAGTQTLTNCYLGGPADTVAGTVTLTTCATSDDSSPDVTLRQIAAATDSGAYFTSITSGSEDFTIGASSALIGVGTYLGATFTGDITGESRGATFDIGAFEYLASYQYARPSSDIADGNWLNENASGDNLYASLDETTATDTDYVDSGAAPSNDTLTVGLSSIDTPVAGTVTLRVRAKTL